MSSKEGVILSLNYLNESDDDIEALDKAVNNNLALDETLERNVSADDSRLDALAIVVDSTINNRSGFQLDLELDVATSMVHRQRKVYDSSHGTQIHRQIEEIDEGEYDNTQTRPPLSRDRSRIIPDSQTRPLLSRDRPRSLGDGKSSSSTSNSQEILSNLASNGEIGQPVVVYGMIRSNTVALPIRDIQTILDDLAIKLDRSERNELKQFKKNVAELVSYLQTFREAPCYDLISCMRKKANKHGSGRSNYNIEDDEMGVYVQVSNQINDIRMKLEDSYRKLNYARPDVKTKDFVLKLCKALSDEESLNLRKFDGYTITKVRDTEKSIDDNIIGWLKPMAITTAQYLIQDDPSSSNLLLCDVPSAEKTTPVRFRKHSY
jgi:hypothetical protein